MITLDEFHTLKCGSVLRITNRCTVYFRTVVLGPADYWLPEETWWVELPIMRRSWRHRASTTVSYNDLRDRHENVEIERRRALDVMSQEEIFNLLAWHEKPSELIAAEIRSGDHGPSWNPIKDVNGICEKLHAMRRVLKSARI